MPEATKAAYNRLKTTMRSLPLNPEHPTVFTTAESLVQCLGSSLVDSMCSTLSSRCRLEPTLQEGASSSSERCPDCGRLCVLMGDLCQDPQKVPRPSTPNKGFYPLVLGFVASASASRDLSNQLQLETGSAPPWARLQSRERCAFESSSKCNFLIQVVSLCWLDFARECSHQMIHFAAVKHRLSSTSVEGHTSTSRRLYRPFELARLLYADFHPDCHSFTPRKKFRNNEQSWHCRLSIQLNKMG